MSPCRRMQRYSASYHQLVDYLFHGQLPKSLALLGERVYTCVHRYICVCACVCMCVLCVSVFEAEGVRDKRQRKRNLWAQRSSWFTASWRLPWGKRDPWIRRWQWFWEHKTRSPPGFWLDLYFGTGPLVHITLGKFTIDHMTLYKFRLLMCYIYFAELLTELSKICS